MAGRALPGSVHVASMSDADDVHYQAVIEHLIQNPVRADAYPVDGVFSAECDATVRSRFIGQQVNGGSDALLVAAGQLPDRLDRSPSDLDSVPAHCIPSSALTSSHGT